MQRDSGYSRKQLVAIYILTELSASNYDATRRRVGDRPAAAAGAASAEAETQREAETHNNEVIKVTEESHDPPWGLT